MRCSTLQFAEKNKIFVLRATLQSHTVRASFKHGVEIAVWKLKWSKTYIMNFCRNQVKSSSVQESPLFSPKELYKAVCDCQGLLLFFCFKYFCYFRGCLSYNFCENRTIYFQLKYSIHGLIIPRKIL